MKIETRETLSQQTFGSNMLQLIEKIIERSSRWSFLPVRQTKFMSEDASHIRKITSENFCLFLFFLYLLAGSEETRSWKLFQRVDVTLELIKLHWTLLFLDIRYGKRNYFSLSLGFKICVKRKLRALCLILVCAFEEIDSDTRTQKSLKNKSVCLKSLRVDFYGSKISQVNVKDEINFPSRPIRYSFEFSWVNFILKF